MLRLVFMGTPEFALPALEAVHESGHEVCAVYCQPPRPADRGHRIQAGPVQQRAAALGLEVRTPESFKSKEEQEAFRALDADTALVAAYGLLLPPEIFDAPRFGTINIHPSLLPRWRGAAPIQRAILAGDKETGVSIMRVAAGLDSGPVFLQEKIPIGRSEDYGSLHGRLAKLGATAAVSVLAGLEAGTAAALPQDDKGVTHAPKIGQAERRIDWRRPADDIDRLVRALSPRPGAWCEIAGERVRVLKGRVRSGEGAPGEVLDDELTVACGKGAYRIARAQRPGRAAMAAQALLRGFPVAAGTRLK